MNISDEHLVKKREKKISNRHERDMEDLRNVLNHASGRRVIWRIMEDCGVFKNCFVESSSRLTDFLLGQKNLGLKIMAEVNDVNPEFYVRMKKENENIEDDQDV